MANGVMKGQGTMLLYIAWSSGKRDATTALQGHPAQQYRRHPTPPHLTGVERGKPDAVWPTGASKPDYLRKEGPSPQRAQEDPRSEGRQPKGEGNP
jgi:hypothetical protein